MPKPPARLSLVKSPSYSELSRKLNEHAAWANQATVYFNKWANQAQQQLNSQVQGVGKALASAPTISPTNPIHHVSGNAAITTIDAPQGFSGPLFLVSDGAWTLKTGGNIASAAGPIPAGQHTILTYDNVGGMWHPQPTASKGDTGPAGAPGTPGQTGKDGAAGAPGAPGLSVLGINILPFSDSPYVSTGFSKSQWLFFGCSADAGADFSFTLPQALGTGEVAIIEKMDANAFAVVVNAAAGELISGFATYSMTVQYEVVILADIGVGVWAVIGLVAR